MLKVKSFDISDDKGINDLISSVRLAGGMHILVSEGKVCIPYEDGEPETLEQRIAAIGEQKNTIINQLDILLHSQNVLEHLKKESEERLLEAEANLNEAKATKKGKEKYDSVKELEETHKRHQSAVKDVISQYNKNVHEIARLRLNIELFDKQIEELRNNHKE